MKKDSWKKWQKDLNAAMKNATTCGAAMDWAASLSERAIALRKKSKKGGRK